MSTTSRRRAWPSLEQLWGLTAITLLALRVQLTPIAPNDFWWHIATGRMIVQSGEIPNVDHFSYTQYGQPYYNQPWLAQLLMYSGYRLGGAAMLELLQALLIALSFTLLYLLCRRDGAGPRVAAVVILAGALVAMDNWQIRPQTYAVPLFTSTLTILWTWRRGEYAPLWALPLLMLVWVNLHGTFMLLIVLCGSVWLGTAIEQLRNHTKAVWRRHIELALWSSLALLAILVNPRGLGILRYVAGLLSNQSVSELVTEWASPLRHIDEPMTIVFLSLLTGFVVLAMWRWRRLSITDVLLVLPFAVLALQSVRNILWFGIVVIPVASRLLASSAPPRRRRVEIVLLNRLIAGLLALLLVATLPWWKEKLNLPPTLGRLLSSQTPVLAITRLRELPQQPERLYHEMGFGSYLIWATPDQPVFVDPRIELYPYDQWHDYITLGQGKEIDGLVKKYGFDGWLVNPETQADLVQALDEHPAWQQAFATDEAIYFGPKRHTQSTLEHHP